MKHIISHKKYNGHRVYRNIDPYKDWTYYSTTGVVGFPNSYYWHQIDDYPVNIGEYSEFTKAPELGVDTNLNVVTSLYLPHEVSWYCDCPDMAVSSISNMTKTVGTAYLINGEPQTSSFKADYYKIGPKVQSIAYLSSNGDSKTARFNTLGTTLGIEKEYPTYGLFKLNDSRFTTQYNNLKTYVTIESSATVSSQTPINFSNPGGLWGELGNVEWNFTPQEGYNLNVIDKGNGVYELHKNGTLELSDYTPISWTFYVLDNYPYSTSTANSGIVLMDYHFISGTWRTEGYYKFAED